MSILKFKYYGGQSIEKGTLNHSYCTLLKISDQRTKKTRMLTVTVSGKCLNNPTL